MDNIESLIGQVFGGASSQDVSSAATAHVQDADPNELADHLSQSTATMDRPSTANLGNELLSAFTQHSGNVASAASAAGTSQESVANGEPGAVSALIQYAKNNPQVLQTAASAFMQRNPSALSSLAPALIQGIMGRL